MASVKGRATEYQLASDRSVRRFDHHDGETLRDIKCTAHMHGHYPNMEKERERHANTVLHTIGYGHTRPHQPGHRGVTEVRVERIASHQMNVNVDVRQMCGAERETR